MVKWRYYKRFGIAGVYEMLSKMTFAEIKSEYNNRREEERKRSLIFWHGRKTKKAGRFFIRLTEKVMTTGRMPAGRGFPDTEAGVLKRHMICETGNGWQRAATVFMCLFHYRLLTLTREIRKICMYCMTGWVSVSEPAVTKKPLSTGERFRQCFEDAEY